MTVKLCDRRGWLSIHRVLCQPVWVAVFVSLPGNVCDGLCLLGWQFLILCLITFVLHISNLSICLLLIFR